MGLFIILLVVSLVVAVAVGGYVKSEFEKSFITPFLGTFVVLAVLVTGVLSIKTVGANKVGIVYNPIKGGVQVETLGEGIHFLSPVVKVYDINTEVQSVTLEELYGQTEDSQYLNIKMDVKYKVNTGNAFNVFKQFRTLKRVDSELISPTTQRAVESITTQYNIMEILGSQRNAVYAEIEMELSERFEANGITLHSVTFLDTDAGDTIEAAIEAEATAKKQVDIAEQKRIQAEKDAERQLIEAEANKQVSILEAQAQAEKIRIVQEQLSADPTYIEYIKWSNWNGVLPSVMSGEGSGLLINP